MEPLLKFDNVQKKFFSEKGELEIFSGLSFEVYPNEIVAIIGPSGCGKSTILNLVSSLEEPTNGQIILKGKLGYMFQKDNLMPWRNIFKNVCLGLEISHQMDEDNLHYALSLLEKYHLIDFKDRFPNELSGGMRQRVSLIRTLVMKPDLLLLDEPFSALDYQTKLLVQSDVYTILRQEKKTALIVTHDVSEAIALCDKIIVLSQRPCQIKTIFKIDFDPELTPLKRRTNPLFNQYFSEIYQVLNDTLSQSDI